MLGDSFFLPSKFIVCLRQSCSVQLTSLALSSCWLCLCLPWAGLPCLAPDQCRAKDNLTLKKVRGQGNTEALFCQLQGHGEAWLLLSLFVLAVSSGSQLCLDLTQLWLVHLYVCVYMPVCVRPCVYVCVCVPECVCPCMCVYPSVYTHVHLFPCVQFMLAFFFFETGPLTGLDLTD